MKKNIAFLLLLSIVSLFGFEPKEIKTLEANFEQKIIKSNQTLTYTGKVLIKLPFHGLWIYNKPQKKIFITDKKVMIEETALEQVVFTSIEDGVDMAKILTQARLISKNLYEAKVKNRKFIIKTNENSIDIISYQDEFDNEVVIKLLNSKINHQVALSRFDYQIPPNFDVIGQ